MGRHTQRSSRQERDELVKNLTRSTHFDKHEVECLLKTFAQLVESGLKKNPLVVERQEFLTLLFNDFELTDDIMMDRVFRAFNTKNDNKLCQEQFVKGMSVLLKGTLSERIAFAFVVYDFNADGYITKEEIFAMYKNCFVNQYNKVMGDEDPEEGIKDLVDIVLKKLDLDNDIRISFNDFCEAVQTETLLMECFGKCFPDEECQRKFLARMQEN